MCYLHIVKIRIAALLLLVPLTARAEFVAGPEVALANVKYAPAPQVVPLATASDGTDFLTLWTSSGGLFSSRVTSSGSTGIESQHKIADASGGASLCWSGEAYLAAWQSADGIMVGALARDGALISAPRKVIGPGAMLQSPALASNGRTALLIYITDPDYTAHGLLLDATGNVLKPDIALPVGFDKGAGEMRPPVLVSTDGDRYAVFWQRMVNKVAVKIAPSSPLPGPTNFVTTHYAVRLSSDGTLLDWYPAVLGTTGYSGFVAVAYARGRYALVASENTTVKRFIVEAATLKSVVQPDITWMNSLQLTTDGNQFILYGINGAPTGLHVARFSGDAETGPLQYEQVAPFVVTNIGGVGLQWNGSRFLATWTAPAVNAAVMERDFSSAEPLAVGLAPQSQSSPAVAAAADQALIAWYEPIAANWMLADLRGVRVRPDGTVLDAEPLTIASGISTGDAPAVAFTGTSYCIAWITRDRWANMRRVNVDGTMSPVVELAPAATVAVASNAKQTAIVFSTNDGIRAVRFSAAGERLDATSLLVSSKYAASLRAATNGTDFLFAWSAAPSMLDFWKDPDRRDVHAARLFASGAADAAPIGVATGAGDQVVSSLASNGVDYLIAYAYETGDVVVKRVLNQGILADFTPTTGGITIGRGERPSVAAFGLGYLVAWTGTIQTQSGIFLIATDTAGHPSGSPFSLSSSGTTSALGLLQAQIVAAYSRPYLDGRSPTTTRIFLRIVNNDPPRQRAIRRR